MSLFKVRSVVGVEMDSFEVRAAEMGGTVGKPSLLGLGKAFLPEGVVRDGKVASPEILSGILSRMWADSRFKSKNVMLGVSNQDVIIRFALIPKCPEDKLDSVIRFHAQDFLPVPVNEVELDYIVLNETAGSQPPMYRVLLVAARRSMLYGFTKAIGDAGLKLLDIDVSILSLARLAADPDSDHATAVVQFTRELAGLAILEKGQPALARILSYGQPGRAATVGGSARREEEAATGVGRLTGTGFPVDGIAGEIFSSISYYLSQNTGSIVEKCMINTTPGLGANIKEKLGERLGIRVEIIDPAKGLNTYHLTGNLPFSGVSDFSAGIGLALRGLEE